MTTIHRHGVVVIHGQGADRRRGDFLAHVVDSIGDVFEAQGGSVARTFNARVRPATASITVQPPPGAEEDGRRYEFVEAYWDDTFPPPSSRVVYGWLLAQGWDQVTRSLRGWLTDPTNQRRGEPADPHDPDLPVPLAVRIAYALQAAALQLALLVAYVIAWPLLIVVFVLNVLASTPGLALFGVWRRLAGWLQALDPFLTKAMGDSQVYVEHGTWSASARGVLDGAVTGLLRDPDVETVSIVAHSAGCGVALDALLEGGEIGRTSREHPKPITLVTTGSAVNRFCWMSARGRTPFRRRFVERRIDPCISGREREDPPAETDEEQARLRSRFFWVDLYGRLDPVPAGRLRDEVVEHAALDPCQVKRRQVINLDDPLADHGSYFRNAGLVVPRVIRAVSGGDWPWELPGGQSWTFEGARSRVARVAALQSIRMLATAAGIAHLFALLLFEGWRERLQALGEQINDALIAPMTEALPLLESWWQDGDGALALTVAWLAMVLVPLLVVLTVQRFVRDLWFADL